MPYTYAGQYGPETIANLAGTPLRNLSVIIYETGTITPVTLYTDRTKSTTLSSSGITATDTAGNLTFFCEPGRYDVVGNSTLLTVTVYPDVAELGGSSGITQLTGDVTAGPGSGSVAANLASIGTAGTYGGSSAVPVITTDAKGRVTNITTVAPSGGAPSGSAGGDLSGTYPNPSLATLSPSPAGTYGSSTQVAVVTVDAKGRVTNVTNTTISASAGVSSFNTRTGAVTLSKADVTGTGLAASDISAVPLSSFTTAGKNKIINADFNILQRYAAGSFASYYSISSYNTGYNIAGATPCFVDRWAFNTDNTGSPVFNMQSSLGSGIPGYDYLPNYVSFGPSIGSMGPLTYLYQRIENVWTLSNQTITVSFYALTNTTHRVTAYQYFGSGGSAAVTVSGTATYSGSGWQRLSVTLTLGGMSGKTINAGSYLEIRIGPNASTSVGLNIWGVQVEEGSIATNFSLASGYNDLALCQRYFYAIVASATTDIIGIARGTSTTAAEMFTRFPQTLRSSPAIYGTTWKTRGAATATFTAVTFVVGSRMNDLMTLSFTGGTGLTTNTYYEIVPNAIGDTVWFDAEL